MSPICPEGPIDGFFTKCWTILINIMNLEKFGSVCLRVLIFQRSELPFFPIGKWHCRYNNAVLPHSLCWRWWFWRLLCIYNTVIMCSQKLHVYLFDEVFVMTRCYNHTDTMAYQVYRQPIALSDLAVKDYADISLTRKGSFRNAFSQLQTSKLFMTIYWCCYVGRRHLYCSEFVIVCVCMCVYMWQCVWVDCCLYRCQLLSMPTT